MFLRSREVQISSKMYKPVRNVFQYLHMHVVSSSIILFTVFIWFGNTPEASKLKPNVHSAFFNLLKKAHNQKSSDLWVESYDNPISRTGPPD